MKSRWVTEGPEVIESRSTGHIGTGEAGRNNRLHRTVREVRWNSSTFVAVRFRWGDATPMANATEGLIREVSFRCSLLALLSPFPSSSPSIAFATLPQPDRGASLVVAGSRKDLQPGTNAEPFGGRVRKIFGDCIRSGVAVFVQGMDRR